MDDENKISADFAEQEFKRFVDSMDDENKISADFAEQEFKRFVDSMDLDLDTSTMDVEDLTAFNKQKSKIIKAVMLGDLVFNEDGEAVYTPCHPRTKIKDTITFNERTGATVLATDGKKKNEDGKKTYAALAEMCRVHPNVFASMVGKDIKLCEAIFTLLMD